MLIFIDEAGDPGFKFNHGSSELFTVALIIFENHEEAISCDTKISILKRELGKSNSFEFHFRSNSDKIKTHFFKVIQGFNFVFYGVVISKKNHSIHTKKNKLYFFAIEQILETAKELLRNANIIIDGHGGNDFEQLLKIYLRRMFNSSEDKKVLQVKMQSSDKNNLLQLADYIASALHQKHSKPGKENYITYVEKKIIKVLFL